MRIEGAPAETIRSSNACTQVEIRKLIDSLFVTKMLAMALLLHDGLLGGVGGEAAGVDGSGEGAWTLATPTEGFLAASGTGVEWPHPETSARRNL
jgi:hypothetical protein